MGVRAGKSAPYWDFDPDTLQETHLGDEQSLEGYAEPGMPKTMSVREMAKLLGIKKTDSYWLLHKDFFKTYVINNTTRIDVRDFERWYASQIKYHKVDGSPLGEELRKSSYSAKDIGGLLGLSEAFAYELIAKESLETITVDGRKRVPRDVFERWYASQSRYRTPEDRERDREVEENSIWLPDLARMLGISRNAVYKLVREKSAEGVFEIIVVAERKRVTKASFYRWYEGQTEFKLLTEEEMAAAKEARERGPELKEPKNHDFYLVSEIAEFYGFSESKVVFHSLRHSSITYKLKLNGGDIKSVQGDSGHSQAKMVTDQYSHIIDEDRKRNAELFEKAFYGNKGAESVSEESTESEHATSLQQPTAQGTETGSGLDIATLTKLANSPEMAALLKALAQNL